MPDRPNILLFLTDDHGSWSLPCYGNSEVRAPNFDRLAAQGVRFANALTPCPVCSPARACLMTGRTPSQVGIHDWIQENVPDIRPRRWLADEIILPQLLHSAGYRCALAGKWHLGQSDCIPPGFDDCFGMLHGQHSHVGKMDFGLNNQPVHFEGNREKFVTDHAIQFLEKYTAANASEGGKPWFLNVGYTATHSPYSNQQPELYDLYKDAAFRDIPPYVPHPWHKNEGLHGGEVTQERLEHHYRSYYAAVTDIDRCVGRLLAWLEKAGQLENTLVIYASDHGCSLGHQGFWGKGNSTRPLNMYEVALRVPLLMRWPGRFPAGSVVEHCVDHYDLFRALCEVAGVDLAQPDLAARRHAGRSLLPWAEGRHLADWDDTRYGEYGDLRMIRTPNHKLVRRYPHGPDELFDLRADPLEKTNLIDDPSLAALRHDLESLLNTFYARHDDPAKSGLRVKQLPRHNSGSEAWRDGLREAAGMQIYS